MDSNYRFDELALLSVGFTSFLIVYLNLTLYQINEIPSEQFLTLTLNVSVRNIFQPPDNIPCAPQLPPNALKYFQQLEFECSSGDPSSELLVCLQINLYLKEIYICG